MSKKITKAEQAEFTHKIEGAMIALGGTRIKPETGSVAAWNSGWSTWRFYTPVGGLELAIPDDFGTLYTVFGRFDKSEEAANANIRCNPYTGKWNHHFTKDPAVEIDRLVHRFAAEMKIMLATEPAGPRAWTHICPRCDKKTDHACRKDASAHRCKCSKASAILAKL